MDMARAAKNICNMRIDKEKKIQLLKDFLLDCYNDMEAQDQNMRPEVVDNDEEGFRIASDCLRELENS